MRKRGISTVAVDAEECPTIWYVPYTGNRLSLNLGLYLVACHLERI